MIGPILRFKARYYGWPKLGPYALELARETSIRDILARMAARKPEQRQAPESTAQEKILDLAEQISSRADYADTCLQSKRDADEIIKLLRQWRPV